MQKIFVFLMFVFLSSLCFADENPTLREDLYNFAHRGDIQALKKFKTDGYSFEISDNKGNSALCEAVYNNDHSAYALLKIMGANIFHPCMKKVSSKIKQKFDKKHEKWLLDVNSGKINWIGTSICDEMAEESAQMIIVKTAPVSSVVFKNSNKSIHPYLSIKGIYSKLKMDNTLQDHSGEFQTNRSDWIWGGSVALGVQTKFLRAELEYNQSATAKNTQKPSGLYDTIQTTQSYRSYMLNGYFDIPAGTSLRPYIGVGIGVSQIENRLTFLRFNSTTKEKSTNFAYQLSAGIGYDLSDDWVLDFGYRFVDNGSIEWTFNNGRQEFKADSTEHQFTAGVRYVF